MHHDLLFQVHPRPPSPMTWDSPVSDTPPSLPRRWPLWMGRAQGPVIIICLVFLWLWSQTYLDSNPASGIYENTSRLRPLTHSPASRIDPRMERYHYPGTFTLQRLWRHCKNRNLEIPGACIKEGRAEYAEYQATETREPLAEKIHISLVGPKHS